MSDSYLFIQNEKNMGIYQDFLKFRKDTFHYILNVLVKEKYFNNKLEAGKSLKPKFNQFYGKEKKKLEYEKYIWKCDVFINNYLENNSEKKEKEKESYKSSYTKINPKKGATSYKILSKPLKYIELESLYGN